MVKAFKEVNDAIQEESSQRNGKYELKERS